MLRMKDLSLEERLKISNELFSNKENGQQQPPQQLQQQQQQQQQVVVEKRRLPPTIDPAEGELVKKFPFLFIRFKAA